jgi:hypothetical protein
MNERIKQLADNATHYANGVCDADPNVDWYATRDQKFAELIVREYTSEYNKLINGESVVLPKDREHAEALVRVGMFYLENNK